MDLKRYLKYIDYFGYRKELRQLNKKMYNFAEAVNDYEDIKYHLHEEDVLNVLRDNMIDEMGSILILLTEFIAKYKIEKSELDCVMDKYMNMIDKLIDEGYFEDDEYDE